MNDDGSEAMPLRELAEYERYLEWRDTECPTEGALSAGELVDAIEQTFPNLLVIRKATEGAAGG